MATEEKKSDGREEKEEEILKSSELGRNVLLSIIVSIGWLVFLILWFAFFTFNYTVYHNIAIILVSILIMGAIFGVSWASWGMKYCWKGQNDKEKKERGWWQLKRIWFGFFIIIFVIAFGIAQPSLWYLFDKNPPNAVIETSNLLLIVITLLAVGLTGFSVLIYESLQERISTRINEKIKEKEKEVHEQIELHVDVVKNLLDKVEKDGENHQTLFGVKMLRSLGYNYWQLFLVWEEAKLKYKSRRDIHAKKISEDLIKLAIDKTKISLDLLEKLPEQCKEEECKSKNNWMYFLAEAVRVNEFELTKQDKVQALKFSDKILEVICEEDYPTNYYEYWESCAWGIYHLSEKEDKKSKQKARKIIRELIEDKNIPPSSCEEIKNKWEEFLEEKNDTSASIKNT